MDSSSKEIQHDDNTKMTVMKEPVIGDTTPTYSPPYYHNRARKNNALRTIASWFAFSLVITQMHTFNGGEWTRALKVVLVEQTSTSSDNSAEQVEVKEIVEGGDVSEPSMDASAFGGPDNSLVEITSPIINDTRPNVLGSVPISERRLEENASVPMQDVVKLPGDNQVNPPLPVSPVACVNQESQEDGVDSPRCCGTWDVNADEWWIHKPTWEIVLENETNFCFEPMKDQQKAAFLRQIHERQWNGNCSHVEKSVEMNSGYGASTSWLDQAFWHAHKISNKPFQIINGNRRWLYSTANQSSWSYCASEDTRCYWLPISNCSRNETIRGEHHSARPKGRHEKVQYYWLRYYLTRPRQHFRRRLYEMRQPYQEKLAAAASASAGNNSNNNKRSSSSSCTAMHVRRGDAGLPQPPFRRYAAVQEYIDAGHIQEGDNIFLMTDDQSTIDEVNKYLPKFNWIYLDRPRNNNIKGGFDGHLPSGDGGLEMLAIHTELQLAKNCDKLVHGQSGFINSLIHSLDLEGKNITRYYLDTSVSKEEAKKFGRDREARVQSFLNEIESLYQNKTKQKQQKEQESILNTEEKVVGEGKLDPNLRQEVNVNATPLVCTNENEETGPVRCCGTWDINADEWWLSRPDWEITLENETSYCFSPITNPRKAEFLREVHARQWNTGNCSEREMSAEINSGLGAGMSWLIQSFWHAHIKNKPFQIASSDWHWMYAPRNRSSWAYCDAHDITCYILPISSCPRDGFRNEDRQWYRINHGKGETEPGQWLKDSYMLRFKQSFRRKVYEMRQLLDVGSNCTMMHVRRADAGFPRPPFRRYAAVQEYLDAADSQPGDTILLLTDDQSTIDEIKKYHPNYNWKYLDRPRNRGVEGGWENHIPSGDGAFEMVAAETELQVAGTCNKFVHGNSGFMTAFFKRLASVPNKSFERYYVETRVSKEEAQAFARRPKERAANMFNAIEVERNKAVITEQESQSNSDGNSEDADASEDDGNDDDSQSGASETESEEDDDENDSHSSADDNDSEEEEEEEEEDDDDSGSSADDKDATTEDDNRRVEAVED